MIHKTPRIERRIDFLLTEAASNDPIKDAAVDGALREASTWATLGRQAGSKLIRRKNKRMSTGARDALAKAKSLEEWEKLVTNEHPDPVNEVWKWIKSSGSSLTTDMIWNRISKHPMVTILKETDTNLRKNGFSKKGTPEERYLGVDIIIHTCSPEEHYLK